MQEFEDDKGKKKQHPICYVSGQFRGSQQNWAALTKEAYAIYMAIRKLSFYITDVEVTIKCDHLPLKKFLRKQTLNAKVNNWAVELEQFNLKLEWIQGIKNTLADSLLRLLEVDPEAKLQPEKEGHEFGTFCFKEVNETGEILPDFWTPLKDSIKHIEVTYNENYTREVKLPLSTKQMIQLQKNDTEAQNIVSNLQKEKSNVKMFILHEGVLCRLWLEERGKGRSEGDASIEMIASFYYIPTLCSPTHPVVRCRIYSMDGQTRGGEMQQTGKQAKAIQTVQKTLFTEQERQHMTD